MPLSWISLQSEDDESSRFRIMNYQPQGVLEDDEEGVVHPLDHYDWITKVVALPIDNDNMVFYQGYIENGDLIIINEMQENTRIDVEDGLGDDYAAVHESCWEVMGNPCYRAIAHLKESNIYRSLSQLYQGQYFQFDELMKNREAWRLIDPKLHTTSAESLRNLQFLQELPSSEQVDQEKMDRKSLKEKNNKDRNSPTFAVPEILFPFDMDHQTLYECLGIYDPRDSRTVDLGSIQQAYRKKQLQYHPSRGGDLHAYEIIRCAYEILSVEEFRRAYEQCDFSDESNETTRAFARIWKRVSENSS